MQQAFIGYAPPPDHSMVAAHLGQQRLSERFRIDRGRPAEAMLIVLAALAVRRFDRTELQARLGRTSAELDGLLASLLALGLVGQDMHLTAAGRTELSVNKRLPRGVGRTVPPARDTSPYYPRQLR
jgi:hypothetical protein